MMKQLCVAFFLMMVSIRLLAPEDRCIFILKSEPVNYYERLINAVTWVESRNDTMAFNPVEKAVGAFQIRQCRVDHYNRLCRTHYTLNDFYNYDRSREMFLYFAHGKSYEQASRRWNGSGKKTIAYWNLVKQFI